MHFFRMVLLIIAVCCLIYLGLLYLFFRLVFWNSDRRKAEGAGLPHGPHYDDVQAGMADLTARMKVIPWEEVWIRSFDGTRLYGRYLEVNPGGPLQIQFPGYRGEAERDMAGGNRVCRENGINTLLVDQRAHGRSGGHGTTFGIRERRDCLAWVQYAIGRWGKDVQITLSGVSMGAATVLMAADLPLPVNVKGILADSPYTSPEDIICQVMRGYRIPVSVFWPMLRQAARIYGHFDLRESSAVSAVRGTELPVLLIHGTDDLLVPPEMSQEIAAAGLHVQLELFPGGAHGISYLTDVGRYWRIELDFMEKVCRCV